MEIDRTSEAREVRELTLAELDVVHGGAADFSAVSGGSSAYVPGCNKFHGRFLAALAV